MRKCKCACISIGREQPGALRSQAHSDIQPHAMQACLGLFPSRILPLDTRGVRASMPLSASSLSHSQLSYAIFITCRGAADAQQAHMNNTHGSTRVLHACIACAHSTRPLRPESLRSPRASLTAKRTPFDSAGRSLAERKRDVSVVLLPCSTLAKAIAPLWPMMLPCIESKTRVLFVSRAPAILKAASGPRLLCARSSFLT